MRGVFIAAGVALAVSILLTPYLIRFFIRQGFGQEIRAEGPPSHQAKRGTPTMGGVAILLAIWVGYLVAHLITGEPVTASAMLVLFLTTALGIVGFLDDFIKIRRQRNLGLNKTAKLVGQVLVATIFAILALRFADADGLTPASDSLSFVRDITVLSFGAIGFVLFGYLVIAAWSNAVNLTDGLDGLAAGTAAMVLRHLHDHRLLAVPQQLRDDRGGRAATRCATRWTWRWSRPRRWAAASASCGGTPPRPGSSWATPARWPSAGWSPGCPS